MKRCTARLLRRLANRLDPPPRVPLVTVTLNGKQIDAALARPHRRNAHGAA